VCVCVFRFALDKRRRGGGEGGELNICAEGDKSEKRDLPSRERV